MLDERYLIPMATIPLPPRASLHRRDVVDERFVWPGDMAMSLRVLWALRYLGSRVWLLEPLLGHRRR